MREARWRAPPASGVRTLASWPRANCSRMRTYSARVSASAFGRSVGEIRPETTPTARLASVT